MAEYKLTTKQAAEQMGLSTAQVLKLIKAGALDARKEGNRWMVNARSVVKWVRESQG